MTEEQIRIMQNLIYALSWHCREGVGPKGMDETFIREAQLVVKEECKIKCK